MDYSIYVRHYASHQGFKDIPTQQQENVVRRKRESENDNKYKQGQSNELIKDLEQTSLKQNFPENKEDFESSDGPLNSVQNIKWCTLPKNRKGVV